MFRIQGEEVYRAWDWIQSLVYRVEFKVAGLEIRVQSLGVYIKRNGFMV